MLPIADSKCVPFGAIVMHPGQQTKIKSHRIIRKPDLAHEQDHDRGQIRQQV